MNTAQAPKEPSPIWIFALFIVLCQGVAGAALARATEPAALIVALVSEALAVAALGLYAYLLVSYRDRLDTAKEYAARLSAERLARQMQKLRYVDREALIVALGQSLATTTADDEDSATRQQRFATALTQATAQHTISVDVSRLTGVSEEVSVAALETTKVADFLDGVWANISGVVSAYTYDKAWVLAKDDGVTLRDMGTAWAEQHGQTRDSRSLSEVGLEPGMHLTALPMQHDGLASWLPEVDRIQF